MKSNFYITFGVWIAILPFLGIPGTWRNTLISLSGLFLVIVSLGPTILKMLKTKPKPRKRDSSKKELKLSEKAPLAEAVGPAGIAGSGEGTEGGL